MRVLFILTTLLAMVGTAVAGPVEDALAVAHGIQAAARDREVVGQGMTPAQVAEAWKPEALKTNQAPATCSRRQPPLTLAAHVWQDRVPMKFLYIANTLLAASVAGCGTLSVSGTTETATSLNGFRASHGLGQSCTDGTLAALASEHAADMARRDSLDHNGFMTRSTLSSPPRIDPTAVAIANSDDLTFRVLPDAWRPRNTIERKRSATARLDATLRDAARANRKTHHGRSLPERRRTTSHR